MHIRVSSEGVRIQVSYTFVYETCTIAGVVRSPVLIHEEREMHAQAYCKCGAAVL